MTGIALDSLGDELRMFEHIRQDRRRAGSPAGGHWRRRCLGRRSQQTRLCGWPAGRRFGGRWRKIKKARQRLLLCRLMIGMMRTVHGAYAPASERFGTRLETFFIALCVALGDIDGKPFSVARIASYVRVPRTTVIRRLNRVQSSGLIDRQGRRYYIREKTLNSLIGMRSYHQVRHILSKAT